MNYKRKIRKRATAPAPVPDFETRDNFYRRLDYVDVGKCDWVEPERGVRLYCSTSGEAWNLQVRGLLKLANARESKTFIISTASLSVDDMRALRDAITLQLKQDGLK